MVRIGGRRRLLSAAAIGACFSLAGCGLLATEHERYPSPNGTRTLVVKMWADMIDPMYPLQLQEGWWTTSIGCVNGDYAGIRSINWLDENTVQLELSDGGDETIPVLLRIADGRVTPEPDHELLHSC